MIGQAEAPLQANLREALRYLGVRGEAPEALLDRMRAAAERTRGLARPRWRWEVFALERAENGFRLPGTALRLTGRLCERMLDGCREAAVLAVTLGMDWEREQQRLNALDPAEALLTDACGSALAEQAADLAEQELHRARPDGFFTERFSPGYGDLPLAMQADILRLLEAEKRLGIWLTAGGLAIPAKTVTAFLGVSPSPLPARLPGCGDCAIRARCGGGRPCGKGDHG